MKCKDFIKDKLMLIVGIVLAVISIETILIIYNISIIAKIYIGAIIILALIIALIVEYIKKKNFYNQLKNNMEELKEKYLISEIINKPNFTEGKILKDVVQEIGKSMLENVNYYKNIRRRL